MQIPFPFEHFNMYFRNTYNRNKLVNLINLALDNYIINTDIDNIDSKKYYQLHNNNTISEIYCASSKIVVYKYLLFRCSYIYSWLNEIDMDGDIKFYKYNINNIIEEYSEYSELDKILYVDLVSVFDKFFNQKSDNFELKEVNIINL